MEELLYESKGTPEKSKKTSRQVSWLLIICGTILSYFSYIMSLDNFEGWIFIGAIGMFGLIIGIAGLIVNSTDNIDKNIRQLAIYTNHVEVYDKRAHHQVSLEWQEVYKVNKSSILNTDILTLETEKGNYVVIVSEINKAHHIIEQKLHNLQSTLN